MDGEIQFGDVEQQAPDVQLRPDRNRHYAVAAVGTPEDGDLPIFVDLDAFRDMELHAISDTSVELGGVLLGGQYEDEDGRPFVVVTDSLRAKHYENSKGSFKFTHDTWSQITRERDEFPEDLRMVGWYHTHPDWGVFLSGMDMFICDNFFNKKLDIALVIDPCRGDRGMFQWTGDPSERVRRTGGFYLTASRFRQYEVETSAMQLKGPMTMSDPRYSAGMHPAPIVNLADNRASWQMVAVLGMLSLQFCLLLLLAWKIVGAPPGPGLDEDQVAALEKRLDAIALVDRKAREAELEAQVLDKVVAAVTDGEQGLVKSMKDQERKLVELRTSIDGHAALVEHLKQEATAANLKHKSDKAKQDKTITQLESDLKDKRLLAERRKERIAALETRIKELNPEDSLIADDGDAGTSIGGQWVWRHRKWLAIGGAVVATVLVGGYLATFLRKDELRSESDIAPDFQLRESPEQEDEREEN